MKIAVIIPLLNEAQSMPAALSMWQKLLEEQCEVILVDGGSIDQTVALATEAGFTVRSSPRGRARQMNLGAAETQAGVLVFLHADTILPASAISSIRNSLQRSDRVWGRFNVRIDGESWMFLIIAWLMNWRSRISGIATGDQAIFMLKSAFQSVACYPDQPLMEDIEISKRLLSLSRPICLPCCVRTSGRRWESRGIWRTIFLMWSLRWAYWRGTSAEELAKAYT